MKVSIVAAVSENGVIGRGNDLPWHLPADLRFFKKLTTGHTIIMGRKTFDSVGRPLPNRRNIIVTRQTDLSIPDCDVVHTIGQALELVADEEEVFIVGGSEIYRLAFPAADRMYLTHIHAEVNGDTFFPEVDWNAWELISDEWHEPDEQHTRAFSFRVYERRGPMLDY